MLLLLLLLLWLCVLVCRPAGRSQEADVQLMQLVAAAEDAGVDLGAGGGGLGGGATSPKARSIQQDNMEYEEFKQPDTDGDNVISKTEVRCLVLWSRARKG